MPPQPKDMSWLQTAPTRSSAPVTSAELLSLAAIGGYAEWVAYADLRASDLQWASR